MFKYVFGILRGIFGGILKDLMKPGFSAFAGITSKFSMFSFHTLVRIAPDEAKKWMDKAVEYYYTPDPEWVGFVEAYMSKLTGKDISYAALVEGDMVAGGAQAAEDLGETFLHPMLNLIMPGVRGPTRELRIKPEDGIDAAERFLGVNLRFQMQAWLLHLIGDIKSFGMWKALKDLPNAISWSYGIGWLSWLVMGVPFRIGISDPLEEFYNELYRPADFSLARLADGLNMGLLDKDYVVDRIRKMGWPEDLIPIVLDMERKKLTKAEAKILYMHDFLSFEEYVEVYHQMQYTPSEAETLATLEIQEGAEKLIESIANEAFDLYVDEMLDEGTLRGYLREANKTPEEIELYLALAQLKRITPPSKAATERKISPANIGNLYKRNKISQTEAIILWLDANVPEDQLEYWLMLYEPEKPPEPTEKELSTTVVGGLYKREEIDADEASLLWSRLDWTQEKIMYLFKYYRRE